MTLRNEKMNTKRAGKDSLKTRTAKNKRTKTINSLLKSVHLVQPYHGKSKISLEKNKKYASVFKWERVQ
jgi:hypothetical protein